MNANRVGESSDGVGFSRLSIDAGWCRQCVHCRVVESARSAFVRCALAEVDDRFAKYPRLPVSNCDGFEQGGRPDGRRDELGSGPPRSSA